MDRAIPVSVKGEQLGRQNKSRKIHENKGTKKNDAREGNVNICNT